MNIGSEEGKGTELYRETHTRSVESALKDRYIGNVEGRGLYQGEADVLICEGFVGNVVLKVSEGMAEFMLKSVAAELLPQLAGDREQAALAFQALSRRYAYSEAGGAPLLGIDGICIICHGSSDAHSIANALRGAAAFNNHAINSQIVEELNETVES
jgi:phosphate acyltransferase